ncbi:MAG: DUF4870 domain-containing protein [Verrucomicrobiae bacterium]|nr:DUF4870 domain-containing protein [Verrucomicrobiae bacterium]
MSDDSSNPPIPPSAPDPGPGTAIGSGSVPTSGPEPLPPSPAPDNARTWEVACHLAAFSGYLTGVGWILGPLIVWLLKRSELPGVDAHGKEALNFQLSVLLWALVIFAGSLLTCGMTLPLLLVIGVGQIVLMIIGAIQAGSGKLYRYPLTIRFIT